MVLRDRTEVRPIVVPATSPQLAALIRACTPERVDDPSSNVVAIVNEYLFTWLEQSPDKWESDLSLGHEAIIVCLHSLEFFRREVD